MALAGIHLWGWAVVVCILFCVGFLLQHFDILCKVSVVCDVFLPFLLFRVERVGGWGNRTRHISNYN